MKFIVTEKQLEYLKEIKSDLTDIERKIVNLKLDDIELVKNGPVSYTFKTKNQDINKYIDRKTNNIHDQLSFSIEQNGQIHGQLPDYLKNLGLAKKIYLKFLKMNGFLKSKKSRSKDAERLWQSLKKENVYYIFSEYSYYLIDKNNESFMLFILKDLEKRNVKYETNIPKNHIKSISEDDYIQMYADSIKATPSTKYTGRWDVNDYVDLSNQNLSKLPLEFGVVTGDFYCSHNELKTLEGSPIEVGGRFVCAHNNLTSLEGSPKYVGGGFYCKNNLKLTQEDIDWLRNNSDIEGKIIWQ